MAKKLKTKKETPNEETTNKEDVMNEVKEEFASMCGEEFNPKPKSSCNRMCANENPEAFDACKDHYEGNKAKSTKKKVVKEEKPSEPKPEKKIKEKKVKEKKIKEKKVRIFDMFGDGRGTTASQINSLLICGVTMEEILSEIGTDEFTGTNKNRVRAHFHSLKVADMDRRVMGPLDIYRDKESGRYFIDDIRIEFYGDCDDCGNGSVKPEVEISKPTKKTSKKK